MKRLFAICLLLAIACPLHAWQPRPPATKVVIECPPTPPENGKRFWLWQWVVQFLP